MKKIGTAIAIGAAALVAATSISAATPAKTTAMGQKNIVQTAVAAGKFKTLVALVKKAGLAGTLSAPGNLTVFAPTDQAFANLKTSDPALYNKVATNKRLLQSVLTYHVVGKRIPAAAAIAAAKKGLKVKTVQGESIALSLQGRQDRPQQHSTCGDPQRQGLERSHPRHRRGPRASVAVAAAGADAVDRPDRLRQPGLLDARLARPEGRPRRGDLSPRPVHRLRAD